VAGVSWGSPLASSESCRSWASAASPRPSVGWGIPASLALPEQVPTTRALVSIGMLGIVCTAFAMLLMFYLVGHAGASRAALITYINPAVATLLGVWLLHERLGAGGITGLALILMGSWLASRGGSKIPASVVREL